MADESSLSQVDQLLQQRARYEQWLAKLDATGSRAPEAVRARVRADYEARLDVVVQELRTHVSAIESALDVRREAVAGLDAQRADVEERLAEAEVRYSVGEYADDQWHAVASEAQGVLDELARRLADEQGEIARLGEIHRLVVAPPAPAPPASAPVPRVPATPLEVPSLINEGIFIEGDASPEPQEASVEPQLRLVVDGNGVVPIASAAEAPPAPAVGAPRFVPRTPMPSRPSMPQPPRPSGAPVDELAFLKSVTGDAPRRPMPGRKPGDSGAGPAIDSSAIEVPAEGGGKAGTQQKTLKCGECGTLNRPTEWYCERCGAELAAL
jgi:hypothetical protein